MKVLYSLIICGIVSFSVLPVATGQNDVSKLSILGPERYLIKQYNKELAERITLQYLSTGVLNVPHLKMYSLELDPLVADNQGELTTLFYHCKELDKTGLVFAFFNDYINPEDYSQVANWRTFKNLGEEDIAMIITRVNEILDKKEEIMKENFDYAVFQYADLTFTFYEGWFGKGIIRVYYNGYESEWSDRNFKKTAKRFEKAVKKIQHRK